jgi:hypothetical protein
MDEPRPESSPQPAPEEVPPPPSAPGQEWARPPSETTPYRAPVGSTEWLGRFVPSSNPSALAAYYCGVFSLIPCLGFVLGPVAFGLGLAGLGALRKDPSKLGKVHAWFGIVLGGLVFLAHAVLTVLILWEARRS